VTPAHFWTFQNWALLGLNVAAESAVLWLSLSRRFSRRLVMLPVFAGFCLLFDLAGTALALTLPVEAIASGHLWYSYTYWLFYWCGQFGAAVVVLLLALQIVTVVLPPWDRLIALLVIILCLALAVAYYKLLPVAHPRDVLTLIVWANGITVLALPIIWLVKPSEWPKGVPLVVAGMVLSLALQAGFAISAAVVKTMVQFVNVWNPLAALVGMGFFLAALLRTETISNAEPAS
jgi:hypothetical protein